MAALGIPSAADIERLTRRLRSVSQRLEGIEDGVDRLDERLTAAGSRGGGTELAELADRLEARLDELARDLAAVREAVAPDARAAAAGAGAPDGLRQPDELAVQARERRPGDLAELEAELLDLFEACSDAVPRNEVGDREQAPGAHPVVPCDLHHGGRLHLDHRRAVGSPGCRQILARVIEEVGRDAVTGACPVPSRARRRSRRPPPRGRRRRARGSRRPRRSPPRQAARCELEIVTERPARADPDQGARAEADQLLGDDRRARPAHASRLHGQRGTVAGAARVAPQPAVVVEHQWLLEQPLRHVQRAVRIPWKEHAFGKLRSGPQVDRRPGHPVHDMEDCELEWRSAHDPQGAAGRGPRGCRADRPGDRRRSTREHSRHARRTRQGRRGRPARSRSVRDALGELEERRPATQEDMAALRKELRALRAGWTGSRSACRRRSPTRAAAATGARPRPSRHAVLEGCRGAIRGKRSSGPRGSRSSRSS